MHNLRKLIQIWIVRRCSEEAITSDFHSGVQGSIPCFSTRLGTEVNIPKMFAVIAALQIIQSTLVKAIVNNCHKVLSVLNLRGYV